MPFRFVWLKFHIASEILPSGFQLLCRRPFNVQSRVASPSSSVGQFGVDFDSGVQVEHGRCYSVAALQFRGALRDVSLSRRSLIKLKQRLSSYGVCRLRIAGDIAQRIASF